MDIKRWLPILLIVVLLVAFFVLGGQSYLTLEALQSYHEHLLAFRDQHPLLAPAIFVAVYAVSQTLSIPGALFLTLLGGAVFGLWLGTPLVLMGASLGATGSMMISRYVLSNWLRRRYTRAFRRLDEGLRREGTVYLFSVRLMPVFPFLLTNLLVGLTAISVWRNLWITFLGMTPGTILYVHAGTQLAELRSVSEIWSPGLVGSIMLIALLPLIVRAIVVRLRPRQSTAEDAAVERGATRDSAA